MLVLSQACVLVYLEAWVGYEPGVIAQVGGVVLHHALGFWLTEVLVGGGEAAGCQHHRGGFWEIQKGKERRSRDVQFKQCCQDDDRKKLKQHKATFTEPQRPLQPQ